MAKIGAKYVGAQILGIRLISVVRQAYPVRRIYVHRLSFGRAAGSCRGITHVADAHVACESMHMTLLKYLANQTRVFSEVKPIADNRDYPGSILSPMLQNRQCVIYVLINRALSYDSNDAAHTMFNLAELPL